MIEKVMQNDLVDQWVFQRILYLCFHATICTRQMNMGRLNFVLNFR